jgi:hypothetical protein
METLLARQPEETERKKNLDVIISNRSDLGVEAVNLRAMPYYSITTAPVEQTEVESLLSSTDESISKLLESPPQFRYAGWGMETEDTARIVRGELRRVKVDQYKLLDLYRDGTLVFVCTATETLLGWGHNFGRGRINPLALVEITYSYFDLFSRIISRLSPPAHTLQVVAKLDNLFPDNIQFTLAPNGVGAMSQRMPHYRHVAPESQFSFRFTFEIDTFDAPKAAFQIVREIYAWFGIEQDKIPYLTSERNAVSLDKLRDPKSQDN